MTTREHFSRLEMRSNHTLETIPGRLNFKIVLGEL